MRRIISRLLVVVIMLAGSACFVLAIPQEKVPLPPPVQGTERRRTAQGEMVMGTLASVGVDRIEIKRQDGTSQMVMVNDQTRYRQAQQDIQLEDLKAGDRVFARGQTNDKKEFLATVVRRATNEEIQGFQGGGGRSGGGDRAGGEIVSIDGNQIKLQNPRLGERIVEVNDQTAFMKGGQTITLKDLKVGDRIFAMGKVTEGKFVAARVMSGPFQRGGMDRRNQNPGQEKQ